MDKFKEIFEAIKADPQNKKYRWDRASFILSIKKQRFVLLVRRQAFEHKNQDSFGMIRQGTACVIGLELTEPLFMSQIKYLFCL
ncbi:hypothetical protein N42HA_00845 [Lactococcus lactis]|nr:hypothetical protein [Lactococcus lactis]